MQCLLQSGRFQNETTVTWQLTTENSLTWRWFQEWRKKRKANPEPASAGEEQRERETRWHFVRLHVSNTVFHTGWFYFLIRYIFYFSGHYDFWICKILLYTKNMYCIDGIGNSKKATFIGMSWKQRLNLLTVLCSPWWGMTLWGNFLFEPIRGDETQEH